MVRKLIAVIGTVVLFASEYYFIIENAMPLVRLVFYTFVSFSILVPISSHFEKRARILFSVTCAILTVILPSVAGYPYSSITVVAIFSTFAILTKSIKEG